MSAEIKKSIGHDVVLIGGDGGIFEIRKDGELLWKKVRGGSFPADGEGAALFTG